MSAAHEQDEDSPAAALPSQAAAARDALGTFCFYLHFAVMIYIVIGWAAPPKAAVVFYLCFLPAVVVQWHLNENSCLLNNIESLIRIGRWRDPNNKEEGAWLATLAARLTGHSFKPRHVDVFIHFVMLVLWGAALGHFIWW